MRLRAVMTRSWHEQRRALLTWGLSLGALGAFMAAIYPSVEDSLRKVAQNYPAALKQAFNVGTLSTVEEYVSVEMFSLIVPLAIGFFGVRSVMRPLVVAEEQGRLDTVLSLPLSRRTLVAGAFLVTVLLSAAILAVMGLMIFVSGRIAGTAISPGLTAAGAAGMWPFAVVFAGLAVLVGGLTSRTPVVTGVAVGTLVAMYALDLAGRLADALEPVRWLSIYRYAGNPMVDGLDVLPWLGMLAAGLLLACAGALLLERRDIGR